MLLALNFYAGFYSKDNTEIRVARDMLSKYNHQAKSYEAENYRVTCNLGGPIDEINTWIDRALGFIDPYVGECIRFDYLEQSMVNVYQNGTIIQWNKFSSCIKEN